MLAGSMLKVRLQGRIVPAASILQRRRVRTAAAADTADDDIVEIADVMDAGLENVDRAVYSGLKLHNPTMMPFTVSYRSFVYC
jgi:hypothetical protein